MSVQGF